MPREATGKPVRKEDRMKNGQISRRSFLHGAAAVVAGSFAGSAVRPEAGTEKPNFVFILIDDMGWSDPGCYGHAFHETPNILSLIHISEPTRPY